MTIKTKYDVGDTVSAFEYLYSTGVYRVITAVVKNITIIQTSGKSTVKYTVESETGSSYLYEECALYPNKESLVNNIINQLKS